MAIVIGWLYAAGLYMMLRRSVIKLIFGLAFLSPATATWQLPPATFAKLLELASAEGQTAMPAAKSRKRLPSTSVTTMPEPDSATSG